MTDIHLHRLLILDFGSQYTQLIARRIRELGVYCEIHPWDMSAREVSNFGAKGIILSGGPESVHASNTPKLEKHILELGVPMLGICYGMQTMAQQLGGRVSSSDHREFGYAKVDVNNGDHLLNGFSDYDEGSELDVWMSHGDKVETLPDGFKVIASSPNAPIAAMEDSSRHLYGIQFHPEVTHTIQGLAILRRFALDICQCKALWNSHNIAETSIKEVQRRVGQDKVLLGLSGGVDSSVVAALLHKAIGDQLTCIFVDTGLLRLNEGDQVMDTFAQHMGVHVVRVDAEDRFMMALEGHTDPEKKRKIIGGLFIDIFEEQSKLFGDARFLAQGTIYPDVIESAGGKNGAKVIKSHHNVGGLPDYMKMELVEPLRELFKDEVRKLGIELGLPEEMVYRHPFPGPGLGVRILGEVKAHYAHVLKQADHIFIEELRKADLYDKVSQAFAVFLPVKSVGVVGDARSYDFVIALRSVETIDFMTARWSHLPYDFLNHVSSRIINEVRGVSRVVYDISGKPPATIEWE
ncbi:MAG: glutamine-hydrolyzing GMP synthase [bacterium]